MNLGVRGTRGIRATGGRQRLQRAFDFIQDGRLTEAERLCQSVLDVEPNNPLALDVMGTIATRNDLWRVALGLFQRAVAADPREPTFRRHLALALVEQFRFKEAVVQLRKALKLQPDSVDTNVELARCYVRQGKVEEGLKLFRDLLKRMPGHPRVVFESAAAFAANGEREDAKALYRTAIDREIHAAEAIRELVSIERDAAGLPELADIERRLDNPQLSRMDRANLHSAAGQMEETAGHYDEAFGHFAKAKAAIAWAFDARRQREKHEALRALFTPEFFAEREGFGDESERPVFIVGMPRSGTSLTEQILASHPQVAGAGELPTMLNLAAALGSTSPDPTDFTANVASLSRKDMAKLAGEYLSMLRAVSRTAERVTDKMPHNYELVGLIALLFPSARIIHCNRHPLDVCLSCFATVFPATRHAFTGDLRALGTYYTQYAALMAYWADLLPGRIYQLSYEDLIADFEPQARALVEFTGLAWDPACLRFHESRHTVQTASKHQVKRPLYTSSVGRWRHYDAHLGPLRAALGDLATN